MFSYLCISGKCWKTIFVWKGWIIDKKNAAGLLEVRVGLGGIRRTACDAQAPLASGSSSHESQPPKITWEWAPPTARGGRLGWAQWQLRRRRI